MSFKFNSNTSYVAFLTFSNELIVYSVTDFINNRYRLNTAIKVKIKHAPISAVTQINLDNPSKRLLIGSSSGTI